MIHTTGISQARADRVRVVRAGIDLGQLVRDQLNAMMADGHEEVEVRWNCDMLMVEARSADLYVCRAFDSTGACMMEKFDQGGTGVERYFDVDGITLVSEVIIDKSEDR